MACLTPSLRLCSRSPLPMRVAGLPIVATRRLFNQNHHPTQKWRSLSLNPFVHRSSSYALDVYTSSCENTSSWYLPPFLPLFNSLGEGSETLKRTLLSENSYS